MAYIDSRRKKTLVRVSSRCTDSRRANATTGEFRVRVGVHMKRSEQPCSSSVLIKCSILGLFGRLMKFFLYYLILHVDSLRCIIWRTNVMLSVNRVEIKTLTS